MKEPSDPSMPNNEHADEQIESADPSPSMNDECSGGPDPSNRRETHADRPVEAHRKSTSPREEELERQLVERDRKAADFDRAYRGLLRDRELATALSGRPLVQGAAAQLLRLWSDEFDVTDEQGQYAVRSRDGRPIDQAVTMLLSKPEFAHFCKPASRGGVMAPGLPPTQQVDVAPQAPSNLGEAIVQQWRSNQQSHRRHGPTGLKPRS